jgi:hypothetical protein
MNQSAHIMLEPGTHVRNSISGHICARDVP